MLAGEGEGESALSPGGLEEPASSGHFPWSHRGDATSVSLVRQPGQQ